MRRRTTIELDPDLLARAGRVLGTSTARATVEAALLIVTEKGEDEAERRRIKQVDYLRQLGELIDSDILASEEMWR